MPPPSRRSKKGKRPTSSPSSRPPPQPPNGIKFGSNIHTLASIDPYASIQNRDDRPPPPPPPSSSSSKPSSRSNVLLETQHIPTLPQADVARSILERIRSEFLPLVQRRGYNVATVTEMCCCGDGLDHRHSNNGSGTKRRRRGGGKKTRTMPNNVLGYNLTTSGGRQRRHMIHLRLRHPRTHVFYPWEDIAGTMCHELAHCVRGPHDAIFYRTMDSILEQHAVFTAKGFVADQDGFPTNSSQAYTLGGGDGGSGSSKGAAGKAAQERMRRGRLGLGGTFVLGGGGLKGVGKGILKPGEVAGIAAERRLEDRWLNDAKYCLPCNEVIEILEGSSDEEEEEGGGGNRRTGSMTQKRRQRLRHDGDGEGIDAVPSSAVVTIGYDDTIDLTSDNSEVSVHAPTPSSSSTTSWSCTVCTYCNDDPTTASSSICSVCGSARTVTTTTTATTITEETTVDVQPLPHARAVEPIAASARGGGVAGSTNNDPCTGWVCARCTFVNNDRPLSLACDLCGSERTIMAHDKPSSRSVQAGSVLPNDSNEKAIRGVLRQDFIDSVREGEVIRSEKEFQGFNIYGNSSRTSGTMWHLT